MKTLFIGGTGLISSACSELAVRNGHALTLLTRGTGGRRPAPPGAEVVTADVADPAAVERALAGRTFDSVVQWVGFTPEHVERDLALFKGRCGQYVFISSASAYQKPAARLPVTEETPLENRYWEYSRQKIACERRLMRAFADEKFPVTIVRPSLTYGPNQIPLAVSCWHAPWTLVARLRGGRPLIIPGDGTSIWVITHNTDFAKGLVGLLGHPRAAGEAFHITSDEVTDWNRHYEAFAAAAGAEPRFVHISSDVLVSLEPSMLGTLLGDKSQSTWFDNAKIKRFVPGFTCSTPFAEGIRETVRWFEADPARQAVDPAAGAFWDKAIASAAAR